MGGRCGCTQSGALFCGEESACGEEERQLADCREMSRKRGKSRDERKSGWVGTGK